MNRRKLIYTLVFLNLFVIIFFCLRYASATFPLVGNDYQLFGPRLLDTLLHYRVNGFSIQWYTPSFGGGLPAYPNPLQMQFSFQQLFTFFTDPWVSILTSSALYLIVGYWVAFLLIRDVFEFDPLSAVLGASFFVANGFVIEQLVVGHADKLTFPIIVLPIYAILNQKLPAWLAGVLVAGTGAVLLNSGGVYIGVMCIFSIMVTLPLVYFLKPSLFAARKMFVVFLYSILFAVLICGSKLYPVVIYMQTFPRVVQDHYFVSWGSGIGGAILQLIGVMTTLPFLNVIGKSSLVFVVRLLHWTGSPYGFWEVDSSISPALLLILIYGVLRFFLHKPKLDNSNLLRKTIAGVCLIFSVILVVQFATVRGNLYDLFQNFPIVRSLRTNTRFMAAFTLPLVLLGTYIFDHWSKGKKRTFTFSVYAILNGLSLLGLWAYYLLPMNVQGRTFDINAVNNTYMQIQAGNTFPVTKIIPDMNDYEVFIAQASNVSHHYDPLLGENSFHPLVHAGSVFDIQDGFYNMTDPTGYVFPVQNNSKLFSLIPVSDYGKLIDFVNRRQPDWKLPLFQIILDWISGITTVAVIIAGFVYLLRGHSKNLHIPPHLRNILVK